MDEGETICPECDGLGHDTCWNCAGVGDEGVDDDGEVHHCDECNGSGVNPCRTCDGNGVIW